MSRGKMVLQKLTLSKEKIGLKLSCSERAIGDNMRLTNSVLQPLMHHDTPM